MYMKEIEITMQLLENLDTAKQKLANFNFVGEEKIMDTYFYDPNKFSSMPTKDKELGECLRLRSKNQKIYVSYTIDKYDEEGNWLYAQHFETEVPNVQAALSQFNQANLKEMMTIRKIRNHFTNGNYEIFIENVEALGNFIEIEKIINDDRDILALKKEMKEFAGTLNIQMSDVLKTGKPEMMLKKLNLDVN